VSGGGWPGGGGGVQGGAMAGSCVCAHGQRKLMSGSGAGGRTRG
jgi:hypothetical protein